MYHLLLFGKVRKPHCHFHARDMELIQVLNLKYTLKCKQAQRKSHKQGKARTVIPYYNSRRYQLEESVL